MSEVTGAICGQSMDTWIGIPHPKRPRCGNGHRERYMDYCKRGFDEYGGWKCGKCGNTMTWQENIDAPHNAWWRERADSLLEGINADIRWCRAHDLLVKCDWDLDLAMNEVKRVYDSIKGDSS